ncbi:MAG: tRNA (adenosine(37)-N6)-threonylcarbamoyltransferase complex transferase subunit TsaD [Christensenellales bacterium]|jgi:N6-L-threonylcarbamoyladenine synthase
MNYQESVKLQFDKLKNKDKVVIMAIESSCDETSVAIVENGRILHSNVIASQIDIHTRFGGVVPEVASRNHVLAIQNVCNESLQKANMTFDDIDAIAVTYGAGLIGALLVGINFAKSLAYALGKPLLLTNHIHGHIAANYISHKNLVPPFTCLIVSGGHTATLEVADYTKIKLVGTTADDAVGEAFDKVARVLGLGYPGGPKIDKMAKEGQNNIVFKTKNSMKHSDNFSFSGIKTAVVNYLHNQDQAGNEVNKADVCASFQTLVVDELATKTIKAALDQGHKKLVAAGGVAANSFLKKKLTEECEKYGIELFMPELSLCTDNAAMIASMAYFNLRDGLGLADLSLSAKSSLPLSTM